MAILGELIPCCVDKILDIIGQIVYGDSNWSAVLTSNWWLIWSLDGAVGLRRWTRVLRLLQVSLGVSSIFPTAYLLSVGIGLTLGRVLSCNSHPRWCRCVALGEHRLSWSSRNGRLLRHRRCSNLHERIFDRSNQFMGEHWSHIHGSWHRIFPRSQHLLHLLAYRIIHHGVRFHEYLKKVSAEIESIRCANIFDDRVEDIEGGKLL